MGKMKKFLIVCAPVQMKEALPPRATVQTGLAASAVSKRPGHHPERLGMDLYCSSGARASFGRKGRKGKLTSPLTERWNRPRISNRERVLALGWKTSAVYARGEISDYGHIRFLVIIGLTASLSGISVLTLRFQFAL